MSRAAGVLALLTPDIVAAILDGRHQEGLTLPGQLEGVAVEWEQQAATAV